MTIAVANVANTNTFLFWQSITNQLAGVISTAAVTTTANGSTAQTAGNAAIGGTFTANGYIGNTLVISTSGSYGNSTVNVAISGTSLTLANSTANIVIVNPTATQISNGQFYLNANGSWAPVTSPIAIQNTATTTGTTTQTIDQWPFATFRSCEYQVNVFDNNANNHYASKIMITHDTATAYITEYAQLISNSSVGPFSATISGANLLLQFTPISTSTALRYIRVAI